MSLPKQVVQAQCPKCKNTLRIPASWIAEPMKCKHCGMVFQAKAPKAKKGNILGRAIRAATTLHQRRKKKKKDGPPVAVPVRPGVPTAQPVLPGAIKAVPTAMPVGPGVKGAPVPTAMPVGLGNGQKPGERRRWRGSWQKIAFGLIFLFGLGSLGAIVYQTNPELFSAGDGGQHAAATATSPATPADTKSKTSKFVAKDTSLFVPKSKPTSRRVTPPPQPTTRKRPPDTRPNRPPETTGTVPPVPVDLGQPALKPNDTAYKNWPRRMLAISINNYLYQNPVSYGKDKPFDRAVYSLSQALRVPNDQVTILSDRAAQSAHPTKAVLEDAISRFSAGSRTMDHVVLLFAGHGIEVEGVPYLVPLMGDKDDVKSLIPLDWVYARLAASPAQQKLLILDVARYDPKAGEQFGKTEPMGDNFATLAQKPPKGVQVMTSCAAGQYSYEIQSDKVHGGVFQEAIVDLNGKLNDVVQKIDEPIPADDLTEALGPRRTTPKVTSYFKKSNFLDAGKAPAKPKEAKAEDAKAEAKEESAPKITQTPQIYGTLFAKTVAFDPKSDPSKKLVVKNEVDPIFKDGLASRDEIAAILDKQRQIPPLQQGGNNDFYLQLPFPKKSLAAFAAKDERDSDLRDFVVKTIKVLNNTNAAFKDEEPPLPENPQQKNAAIKGYEQKAVDLAEVYAQLDTAYEELKSVEKLREKETPRWKANYDYVTARLLFRMVHFYEYQVALGKIRKDDLPPFDKDNNKVYKLSAKAKLSDRGDEITLANQAKKVLERLAKDSKGTPWEVVAKREMNTSLGLEWVAK